MFSLARLSARTPQCTTVTIRCCSTTSDTKSQKTLKGAALGVHRQLLNQFKKWPIEEGREDRSIKTDMVPFLEKRLSELNEATDKERIMELGTRSQKDLTAVTDLLGNKYFKQYRLEAYAVPPILEKQSTLLSSKSQQKMRKRRWGFLDRLLTWYLEDGSEEDSKNKKESKKDSIGHH
eukprot:TRINITY_DN17286_c0_g1_i1.p1 TRINITY_DN17286_c0_g1~~TRINITY_DN17286_c0_g1_i1.p1  ORF type:complete len:178 (+),score=38.54 TRINITY_DN17286_c0_g1_i1:3-536(+)